ncbi:aminotransferase [Thiocapsa imhoffii]|uniref:Aminotransferase n=1 Tax=Thiocapsa imhoffii TaxID=382777 RepID=A0A9X1B9Y4_9GAMM|nr:aminotransferase class V-fold PLP-dependent enzyme [Thiocapsa imhoffii]MBK1645768.1 aminotransferase [Thiocapsa imhoffii]
MTSEFPLDPELCHLNHAAVGPWPARTVAAIARFAEENARLGSLRYSDWLSVETRLRERLARLIGAASPDDIALAKNTSEALSIIAHGCAWQEGDEVVGIAQEFPSNRVVWESLRRHGVRWVALDLERSQDPEAELIGLCGERTRMIAISWVQYARGRRLDLERLGAWCRNQGVLLCVDAIQGLGACPGNLIASGVDFVVADGHKWMLGPEGVALLYVNPLLRPTLTLHQFGWHMLQDSGNFERRQWEPATDARRFECGSPNQLGVHALEASLSLLEEVSMTRVWDDLQRRTEFLIDRLDQRGFELLSPRAPAQRAGIVTFRVPDRAADRLYAGLMRRQVLCAHRGGGIRFSPHFYTPFEVIERAVEQVQIVADEVARS